MGTVILYVIYYPVPALPTGSIAGACELKYFAPGLSYLYSAAVTMAIL